MRWSSARPSTSGIGGGEEVGLDAPGALDLGRDLELRGAQLVVQRHRRRRAPAWKLSRSASNVTRSRALLT